jgi:adenylate cyclase
VVNQPEIPGPAFSFEPIMPKLEQQRMSIRLKIVLIVVPLIVATLLLTGISSYFAATSGISRIAKDFLGFKAQELQNQAESQWGLLVSNKLTDRPEMVAATQAAVEGYARTIIRSATELILAVGEDGAIRMSSTGLSAGFYQEGEQAALAALAKARSTDLLTIGLGGKERVAKGFWFGPFGWYVVVTEERAAFYDQVNQIAFRTLMILAVSICAGVLLVLLFANYLTRPLTRVAGTMKEIISTNDLSKRVVVEYHDEIGQLAQTFNLMVGELEKAYRQIKSFAFSSIVAQKREQKFRNIFQKYVPREVIESVIRNPEAMLVGENRVLSILFCDIPNFPAIAESMPPDELVNTLNRYFSVMVDNTIIPHQGTPDKYIEYAIMALFGAPVKTEHDALNSVLAGIDMADALDRFNEGEKIRGRIPFTIGIGINYGVVTVGNIGSEKKMDYTVIGDMVNLASRLSGLTKTYQQRLIISESLHSKVKDDIPCRLLDTVAVKGRKKGIKIFAAKKNVAGGEKEAWDIYENGMSEYYARNFTRAIDCFRQAQALLPGDTAARILMERSQGYLKNPPPADWDGVEVMHTK